MSSTSVTVHCKLELIFFFNFTSILVSEISVGFGLSVVVFASALVFGSGFRLDYGFWDSLVTV